MCAALEAGYRGIDTAVVYRFGLNGDIVDVMMCQRMSNINIIHPTGYVVLALRNHKTIADTLRETLPKLGLERKDLFITSKLGPKDHGGEKCQAAIDRALEELETDYLDLFLIHWPGVQGADVTSANNAVLRQESWKTMEENFKSGKLRAIGVSNYTLEHLHQLLEACEVVPHVLQVEVHPK